MGNDGYFVSGRAVTFVTPSEAPFAADLAASLIRAGQEPSPELLALAKSSGRFRGRGSGGSIGAVGSTAAALANNIRADGSWVIAEESTRIGRPSTIHGLSGAANSSRAPGLGATSTSVHATAPVQNHSTSSAARFGSSSSARTTVFTRAENSAENFTAGIDTSDLQRGTQYRPPMPESLLPTSQQATIAALDVDAALSARVKADVARAAINARATAAAAGVVGIVAPTAETLLAAQDGDNVDDVDIDAGDDGELLHLRRTRGSRFGGSSLIASSDLSGRDAALAELSSAAQARSAASFSSSFVRAESAQLPGDVVSDVVSTTFGTSAAVYAPAVPPSQGLDGGVAAAPRPKRSRWGDAPPVQQDQPRSDIDAPALAAGQVPTSSGASQFQGSRLLLNAPASRWTAPVQPTSQQRSLYVPGVRY